MQRAKRDVWVSTRTITAVKDAVRDDAIRQHRSESELVHLLLCRQYGINPITGDMVAQEPAAEVETGIPTEQIHPSA